MTDDLGTVTLDGRQAHAIATVLARLALMLDGERYPNDLQLTYDQVHLLGAPRGIPPQRLADELRADVALIENQLPDDVPSLWA